jgi:chromosome segregation ATPase
VVLKRGTLTGAFLFKIWGWFVADATEPEDTWKRNMEQRVSNFERLGNLLKDELSGLRTSIMGLINADREKLHALEGHHQAYAAAAQRAELAEARALRAEKRSEGLESEVRNLEHQVETIQRKLPGHG